MRMTFSVMFSTVRFFIGGILTCEGSIVPVTCWLNLRKDGIWVNCSLITWGEVIYKG